MTTRPEIAPLRAELLKSWIDKNKEYLAHALSTNKVEISFNMKDSKIYVKVTQFPAEE